MEETTRVGLIKQPGRLAASAFATRGAAAPRGGPLGSAVQPSDRIASSRQSRLPPAPVDRLADPIARFLHIESASGAVLLVATAAALLLANSRWGGQYQGFWETSVGMSAGSFQISHSLKHWINDALMVIFFFVIGLEVKREIVFGELRDLRTASLPIAAALGGMVVPALI